MRPRLAGPSPRAPRSHGTRARARPLRPPTYRAQADPKALRDPARLGQPAARHARAYRGPSVQKHFFGRHDTLPLPPDFSPGRPEPAFARARSQQAATVWDPPSHAPPVAGGGGARSSHLCRARGRGEAGRAERRPNPVSTSPDPPTARAVSKPKGKWRPSYRRSLIPAPN